MIQVKINLFIISRCNVLKPEIIFVNPVVKHCVATWLMTDLCVNIHQTWSLSECILAAGYFRKENLKDEKEELGEKM